MGLLKRNPFHQSDRSGGWCVPAAIYEVAPKGTSTDDVRRACLAASTRLPYTGGMYRHEWEPVLRSFVCVVPLNVIRPWSPGRPARPTLAQFSRSYPRGVYLVAVAGHVLTVRNGRVIDPNWGGRRSMRRRVECAYLIENPGPQKHAAACRK